MEAVAAAASIAGIITLVFQSIDGLAKFKELFSDVSSASKTISGLLVDINSLIHVLEDVRNVLEQFEAQKANKNYASLDIKLADCSKDIQVWISTAKILRPPSEQGGKAWLKKFRLAVNKNAVQTIRHDISRHRQIISLSLSVLGRNIDIDTSEQVNRVQTSLSQTLSNHDAQEAALWRIENISRASLQSSTHSLNSMDGIRSELSRLESMIMQSRGASQSEPAARETKTQPNGCSENETHGSDSATPTESLASSARAGINEHATSRDGHPDRTDAAPIRNAHMALRGEAKTMEKVEISSSFLYATFATSHSSSDPAPPDTELSTLDCHALYDDLQRSLSDMHAPCVAKYITLHQTLTLFKSSIRLLQDMQIDDSQPSNEPLRTKNTSNSLSDIQQKYQVLSSALLQSRDVCLSEGYSLTAIDRACQLQ